MQSTIKDYFMAHGSSRAQTRSTEVNLDLGIASDKELLSQILCLKKLKNTKKFHKFKKCNNKRCKTCPLADCSQIDSTSKFLFCKSFNIIYLIQCNCCNLCYVGQTSLEFHKRINSHRSAIKNFKDCNNTTDYELLHFQFHDFDNITLFILDFVDKLDYRLDLENIYIGSLKTLFPYGLNSKFNGEGCYNIEDFCIYDKCKVFGFPKNNYSNYRFKRGKGNKCKKVIDFEEFLSFCDLSVNLVNIYAIRKFIFGFKNKVLINFLHKYGTKFKYNSELIKFIILDLIKSKIGIGKTDKLFSCVSNVQKVFCTINFQDKCFENAKIPQIIHSSSDFFPLKSVKISTAFRYSTTLRKKICNYNFLSKNLGCISKADCCCQEFSSSSYFNDNFGHVITGDLNIVGNEYLVKILSKGSKFRTRNKIKKENFILSLKKDLDLFIAKISRKFHWPFEGFTEWKTIIVEKVKLNLKNCNVFLEPDDIVIDHYLANEIKKLKNKFIITVVDKASNNFCIMCKYFFRNLIIREYNANKTFIKLNIDKKIIEKRIIAFSKKLKFKLNRVSFPYLFPIVKFHKDPISFRFITCGTNSYNSVVSKRFFGLLKVILGKIMKEKNIIIDSNIKVLDYIKNNSVYSINTFDFENLYTSIPHDRIIDICNCIFDKYLFEENLDRFYWLDLCKFNLFENVLFNGLDYYKQIIGIPQGNSFSGAFANIFLHFFEEKYLANNDFRAFRYIDDLIIFNYDCFDFIFNIYPVDLILKKTNKSNLKVEYLDFDINISNRDVLIGVYDKRKAFNFSVIFFCNYKTNLSSKIFKNLIFSQIDRINKICNNVNSFKEASNNFLKNLDFNDFPPNYCNVNFLIKSIVNRY